MSRVFLSYVDAMSQSHKGTRSQSHMSESEWLPTILKVSGATTHFQTRASIESQMFRTKHLQYYRRHIFNTTPYKWRLSSLACWGSGFFNTRRLERT